jgi:hypothetical protein
MHRRAIPNACWVLRLHVFDLYSERSQFDVQKGSVVYGPWQAHVYRQDESKGIMEKPL